MIKLYGGNESLQVVSTGASTSVDFFVDWTDINANSVVDSGVNQGNIASASTTLLVSAPSTNSYTRQVQLISLTNNDPVNSVSVAVQKGNSSGVVTIGTGELQTLWSLKYQNDVGWQVFDDSGIPVSSIVTTTQPVTLVGDVTGSGSSVITTTLDNVNTNVGTFGDGMDAVQFSVNAKGLVTGVTTVPILGDLHYLYTQGLPSALWVITHNLNKYPSVSVVDSTGADVEGDITYISLSSISITFSSAFSGEAFIN